MPPRDIHDGYVGAHEWLATLQFAHRNLWHDQRRRIGLLSRARTQVAARLAGGGPVAYGLRAVQAKERR